MGKVKCPICNEYFDKEKIENIKINNRYLHINCYNNTNEGQRIQLENYIKKLMKIEKISPLIKKQIDNFYQEKQYSYKSILFTLKYFYEIKKGDITKAKGIGIVDYVYEEAKNFYKNIEEIKKKNQNILINNNSKIINIEINSPKQKIKKKKINLTLIKGE